MRILKVLLWFFLLNESFINFLRTKTKKVEIKRRFIILGYWNHFLEAIFKVFW